MKPGRPQRKRVAREGKHRVYLDFMKQLFTLRKHGQTAQFWADIIMEHPDLMSELPKVLSQSSGATRQTCFASNAA